MKNLLKIGELAKQANVTVATIRYYESLHLLEPVSKAENGYRYYDETTVSRLQFIKQAQSLQFSLAEIQQVIDVRNQGEPVCNLVKALLDQKIATLEQEIQQAATLKTRLDAYRTSWVARPLDNPSAVKVCSLIEEVGLPSPG
ncbi:MULTISPECIES: heavy metal-responsive transcriptional regulator [Cyanophyceae]|uniref:heavy metal-responsive transcriptional regulator n=1 Tax=Cyanophyceae TaxID=3028117 RepID=UPI0016822ED8|nr:MULTISPECIES: heavy metal-responsive transcriptional regulator [Cyanophyceae]MBD1919270.1 heavy metal-responsive transcriptional regulator [Phormidium sp. FACHB-77]MBD2032989.1 heavy metal-responsive transcriptional regulator [Phormidium sp. FACHB-322]MBD2054177.1 heavy metal-responsive transcriptional regulator [Leptolyngbya sp. FACHB-60]